MTNSGDAAEQIVRMSLEGTEVALRLSGSAAKNIAVALYTICRQQPCLLCDGIQLDKILSKKKVEPFLILLFLSGKYAQQIAVVKIQCPETSHLFTGLPISGQAIMCWL